MSRFEPAPDLEQILADETKAGRAEVALDVIDGAKRSVHALTGHYARSLRVFDDRRGIGAETTDVAGHIIEWGSSRQAPQAPLRTGASMAGKFEPR